MQRLPTCWPVRQTLFPSALEEAWAQHPRLLSRLGPGLIHDTPDSSLRFPSTHPAPLDRHRRLPSLQCCWTPMSRIAVSSTIIYTAAVKLHQQCIFSLCCNVCRTEFYRTILQQRSLCKGKRTLVLSVNCVFVPKSSPNLERHTINA